jgi:hypothetical protein
MTRFISAGIAAGVLMLSLAGCNNTSPTAPTNTAIFVATLSPANEVPPVTNAEAGGTGGATISMYLTRDNAGVLTNVTMDFQANLTGFPAGTTLQMAHIHRGVVGQVGLIVVDTGLTPGDLVTLATGSGGFTKLGIAIPTDLAQEILNVPSTFYFNVHSVLNPTGVARGQLIRQQ